VPSGRFTRREKRKLLSIISLLFGIAQEKHLVHLHKTIAELGIDEPDQPLSATEKFATIRDLLMARSGVYIESEAESAQMKARRRKRGRINRANITTTTTTGISTC
jgi:DNA polymerase III delta prime subunit